MLFSLRVTGENRDVVFEKTYTLEKKPTRRFYMPLLKEIATTCASVGGSSFIFTVTCLCSSSWAVSTMQCEINGTAWERATYATRSALSAFRAIA